MFSGFGFNDNGTTSSLNELALFRDIKTNIALNENESNVSKGSSHQKSRFTFDDLNQNGNASNKKKMWSKYIVNKRKKRAQYYPPLAAYNTFDETPFIPQSRIKYGNATGAKFDEMVMKEEMMKKRLKDIQKLGWNFIRSIGVSKTMQQLEEEHKALLEADKDLDREGTAYPTAIDTDLDNSRSGVSRHFDDQRPEVQLGSSTLPSNTSRPNRLPHAFQENIDDDGTTFSELNEPDHNREEILIADEYDEIQEDELSYDYSEEYARVEDDYEENTNGNRNSMNQSDYGSDVQQTNFTDIDNRILLHRNNSESFNEVEAGIEAMDVPIIDFSNSRQTEQITDPSRNLELQQYVESSHLRNSVDVYDVANDYDYHRIDADADTADSHDYSEVPSLNVSDPPTVNDNQRVSSLTEAGRSLTIEQFERIHESNLPQ
ncbi:hypothetical protein TPHA_0N01820 [Tetrapisispora phaffii CBS 4417]|uniref:Uncharacterized protein n=1 Tax=Tetrapisispora phaffii (strain ATCC 24235 / CBS 4417 / NBRC 1672 / NRRL Y-8282 / UCD 70-5) TaxID=1071381 RepID=G8C1D5_TETPH|nr:hypothetical protein TPHA_0N01820 [Tetrapisispora phaffii CBS 4417]CCE65963.1 hypothetical protein TPHA_0N01820 [Tetrapisispora phaffii CBS 4417]